MTGLRPSREQLGVRGRRAARGCTHASRSTSGISAGIWQNFRVTDNLALTPNDFDVFSMTVPTDPRLPGGGGYTLGGLVALKQQAFGRPPQNHNTLDRVSGEQIEHWNGFDVTASATLRNGLTLNGGVSTGRTVEDDCEKSSPACLRP